VRSQHVGLDEPCVIEQCRRSVRGVR
jgi:hypothetical protein